MIAIAYSFNGSEEDQLYLVPIPEFVDMAMQPCTYGKTYADEIANAQDAIAGYLESCQYQAGQFKFEPPRHQGTKNFVLLCGFVVPHFVPA
jgi:predicted RNase H-like HicB family nuclease